MRRVTSIPFHDLKGVDHQGAFLGVHGNVLQREQKIDKLRSPDDILLSLELSKRLELDRFGHRLIVGATYHVGELSRRAVLVKEDHSGSRVLQPLHHEQPQKRGLSRTRGTCDEGVTHIPHVQVQEKRGREVRTARKKRNPNAADLIQKANCSSFPSTPQ